MVRDLVTRPRVPRWRHIRMYRGPRRKALYVARRLLGLDTPSADLVGAWTEGWQRGMRDLEAAREARDPDVGVWICAHPDGPCPCAERPTCICRTCSWRRWPTTG